MTIPATATTLAAAALLAALPLTACAPRNSKTLNRATGVDHSEVGQTLDAWHDAAAQGDIKTYFNLTTEGFVFLGTDAKERWTREEFRAFAEPHFADGHGWTYTPVKRFVHTNSYGDVAWVDEVLRHDTYGSVRGTAVLRSAGYGDDWRVAHYTLSFLVPNEKVEAMLKAVND